MCGLEWDFSLWFVISFGFVFLVAETVVDGFAESFFLRLADLDLARGLLGGLDILLDNSETPAEVINFLEGSALTGGSSWISSCNVRYETIVNKSIGKNLQSLLRRRYHE